MSAHRHSMRVTHKMIYCHPTTRATLMLLMAAATVGATIGIILISAARLGNMIGSRGQRILLRFMGLILAAAGAEILLSGVYTFVPRSL